MTRAYVALLLSHAFTKFGSKGWEFATPLLLLQFSPDGSVFAPTVFGLSITVLKLLVGPAIGRWIDGTERMRVVVYGVALQVIGVLCALGVLGLLLWLEPPSGGKGSDEIPWPLLCAMVCCGAAESLGALISSVAVKKDWVPAIWAPTDPTLASVNANMANIDLVAECVGPLVAGFALQVLGDASGFVAIGLTNALTFGVELLLLRTVFLSHAQLATPKPAPDPSTTPAKGGCGKLVDAWPIFLQHPSGIPLLVVSYALLYFTVLSPHGVVLTAYLQTQSLSPVALSAFRAAGALAGVAGMRVFKTLATRYGLRLVATAHLWLLSLAVLFAASLFPLTHDAPGLSTPMLVFLSLVVVSRFGLYGFDLANLQLQQVHVDETHRGAVGAVESSLCALGTGSLLVATLYVTTGEAASFDTLVYTSAGFVGSAAVVYSFWVWTFHEHEHEHPLLAPEHPSHGGGIPGAVHKHTSQQRRSLEESGEARTHVHLHFHPPWRSHAHAHRHDAETHTHYHLHTGP